MDLCYRFIADVFDTETVDPYNFIKNKELDLDAILAHNSLKLNMLYSIVWNCIYNTYPSKYDYRDYLARTANTQQHDVSMIMQSFWILKMVAFDMNALQKKISSLLQHLSNPEFVKTKILEKWYYRYYPHFPDPSSVSKSIFHTYITHVKKVDISTGDPPIFDQLPSGNIDYHPTFNLKYGTELERLQYMIHKDIHFCRRLVQNGMIIVEDKDNPHPDAAILADVLEIELVLEYDSIKSMLPFIPKIAKAIINLTPYQILNASFEVKDLIDFSDNDFKKVYYKALINQSRELVYFKYVLDYFKKHPDAIAATEEYDTFAKKRDNVIVLIDNRPNIMSVYSVLFAILNMDKDKWNVVVYTSNKSKSFYEQHLGKRAEIRTNLSATYLDAPRFNIDVYNKFMMSSDLWRDLESWNKTLIIQDDGVIVRPGVEKYLKWDYIGAPWIDAPENDYLKEHVYKEMVGNGGLSLRSIKAMVDISTKYVKEKNQLFYHNIVRIPEDAYFVKAMVKEGCYKLPNKQTASEFSSEQIINMSSIGFHKFWAYNDLEKVGSYFSSL